MTLLIMESHDGWKLERQNISRFMTFQHFFRKQDGWIRTQVEEVANAIQELSSEGGVAVGVQKEE